MRTFKKSPRVVERKVRDSHILVPLGDGTQPVLECIYTLNETSAFIWEQAGKGVTETEIATELQAAYDVAPERARADTRRILDELVKAGAITPCPKPHG